MNAILAPTGNVSVNSYKLTNLANATTATDAMNRQSADSRYYLNTTPLNNITLPVGNVTLNNNKLTNVTDPTLIQDAATKNYVDS